MTAVQKCRRCGMDLSGASMGRLCPRCLLHDAVEPDGEPGAAQEAPAGDGIPRVADPSAHFGDYELLEVLGRGGMGVVYKARQISLNRTVALKMILAGEFASPAEVRRFHAEAEAAANLEHPHIVPIHEVGTHEGQHYFSMKLIEGGTLAKRMRHDSGDHRWAARLIAQVASAVHYAHQHGILHRDLKPGNILLDAEGQPYVTDFGLARRVAEDSSLTLSGQLLGTPSYMAPEQVAGKAKPLSIAADIYSLGAILYELLTGQPPFAANTPLATLQQVRDTEPRRPTTINQRINRDLETICLKCLEKDPQRRYASAGAFAEDLERWLEGRTILARRVGQTEKLWRWCRRKPMIAGLAAALILVFALGSSGVLWQWRTAVAERSTSRQNELTARRNAYAADMILVQQALTEGDVGQARSLLERNRPLPGQEDLRGWEWRYRWQQCQKDPAFLDELLRHSESIKRVAISPDGKWLAAGALDGWVGVVELGSRQRQTLQEKSASKAVVAFSPHDSLLAFTWHDGNSGWIKFRNLTTGQELPPIAHDPMIQAIAFSADGTMLAASAADEFVTIWDLQTRKRNSRVAFGEVNWPIFDGPLAVSPQASVLAIGSTDGKIQLVSLSTGARLLDIQAHANPVFALAFSPDGRILASGGGFADGSIRLWDAATGKAVGPPLVGHNRYIHALAFSPKGAILASASADQSIRLWDVQAGKELGALRGHGQEVWTLAFSPDGNTLASGCKDGSVGFWSTVPKPRQDVQVLRSSGTRYCFAYLPDGKSLAVVSLSGSVSLWDADAMRSKEDLTALGTKNLWPAVSPDGRYLAVGGLDGYLRAWDLAERHVATSQPAYPQPDRAEPPAVWVWAAFSRDRAKLFTVNLGGSGNQFAIREAPTWKPIAFPPVTVRFGVGAAVSPDARLLATGYPDSRAIVWNLELGRIETELRHQGEVFGVGFSPDGTILATGSYGTVILWDTRTWQALTSPLSGHQLAIHSLTFSHDGTRLATSGGIAEEAVLLWDVTTRRRLATLRGEGTVFRGVTFSPDGNTIIAQSSERHLNIWRAPSWAEIEAKEREQK
ncbi:MAG: protein kinase [Planctomycetota bacterium]|nr:protein kinase [Planctomycetota bacterium]